MSNNLSDQSIARDDVPLDNLTKTFKVVIADDESATDSGSWLLSLLIDVDVHEVLFPELPSQRDTVLTACRWTEDKVTSFTLG